MTRSVVSGERTTEKIRALTADELGVGVQQALEDHVSNRPDDPGLALEDPMLEEVVSLLDSYGGVIFTGPPGTSKTWYAQAVGEALADWDEDRFLAVQFHPSYQYEDFMEGYVPDGGGFVLRPKHFVQMCLDAAKDPDHRYVLVIDELSRGDPGRVFGEALTYVEHSKRGREFSLASGRKLFVPPNLVILATMNPLDRGVDEVDAAFERRFAKIAMEPSEEILSAFLDSSNVDPQLSEKIKTFFKALRGRAKRNPHAAVGHTFFMDVADEEGMRNVWRYQLRFLVEKAYRVDQATADEIRVHFESLFGAPDPEPQGPPRVDIARGADVEVTAPTPG